MAKWMLKDSLSDGMIFKLSSELNRQGCEQGLNPWKPEAGHRSPRPLCTEDSSENLVLSACG